MLSEQPGDLRPVAAVLPLMPGPLVAFFILIGLGTGAPAVKGMLRPIDRGYVSSNTPLVGAVSAPRVDGVLVWTAPQWVGTARRDAENRGPHCHCVLFAVVRGGGKLRMQLNGIEQQLDSSWSFDFVEDEDRMGRTTVTFLRPEGGAVVYQTTVEVKCIHDYGVDYGALYDERGLLR